MFSRIFIERPRMAMVISIVVALAGVLALLNIPIAQYPQITPPEIRVSHLSRRQRRGGGRQRGRTPGGRNQRRGGHALHVLHLLQRRRLYLSVTFAVGTDPDIAQVNVQNRVQQATAKLPSEVTEQGISVRQRSSDMLAVISFFSPEGSRTPCS
jgi:multidrug efflux pump subunit AcrB